MLPRLSLRFAALGYLALLLAFPVGLVFYRTFEKGIAPVWEAVTTPEAMHAFWLTCVMVAVAVPLNTIFGVACAIVLVRHRFLGRGALDALVDLTLAVSPVMTGLAFLLLVGRGGWLAPLLDRFDARVAFAFPGLVLATLFVTLPFTVREVGYVLQELGTDEEEVAATLGATPWQTFRRVTLPNIRGALVLGVTLTAARALGEFGAVLVVGGAISGQTATATTFIYAMSEERRDAAAFGMAIVLAAASALFLVALEAVSRRRRGASRSHPA